VNKMALQSIIQVIISGIFVAMWGCSESDNNDSRTNDDPKDSLTDSMIDPSVDTNSDPSWNTDPDTALGTDAPETSYQGFEDQYILTADDDPVDVCRIRYELHAVAEPAVPCTICEWDVVLEKRNPSVLVDLNNACANSDFGLDEAAISASVGERVAYGFAEESVGHASILMRYNIGSGRWEEYTVSNWNPLVSEFRYKRRDGMCSYAGADESEPSTSGICGISGKATVTQLTDRKEK
jgi:hypothetical protein